MNFLTNYHLPGMAPQVRFIRERKKRFGSGYLADERPTSTINLNWFFASSFGFYSLLAYGLCLER